MKYVLLTISIILKTIVFSQTGSLSFDGIDDYVEIENSTFNAIDTGNFTIEAWINGNESNQNLNQVIFSNRSSENKGVMLFFRQNENNPNYKEFVFNIDSTDYSVPNNFSLDNNYCYHIAITRENNVITFFSNGSKIDTIETEKVSSVSSPNNLFIGKDYANPTNLKGLVGGIRIWNKALNNKEVLDFQHETISRTTLNLIGYWDFKLKTEQVIIDLTGNNNGILGNSQEVDQNDPSWVSFGSAPRIDLGADTLISIGPFENTLKNPDNAVIKWSDGFQSTQFIINKIYYDPGTYWAEAKNACGVTADSIDIRLEGYYYLPNVFTPDGNSFNETYRPYIAHNPDYFKFIILTRDRQIAFESRDPQLGWDGTYNNSLAPSGVYIWLLQFTNVNTGILEEYKGTVTLLR